jgi:hypothetical protein
VRSPLSLDVVERMNERCEVALQQFSMHVPILLNMPTAATGSRLRSASAR